MRSSRTSPPERPDWESIAGEVAALVERVRGVALRARIDAGAILDALAEELAAPADLPLPDVAASRPVVPPKAA